MNSQRFTPINIFSFLEQACLYVKDMPVHCTLWHHETQVQFHRYDFILAAGVKKELMIRMPVEFSAFEELDRFYKNSEGWVFGFLGYDLKNQTEKLVSQNPDHQHFPDLHFFEPEWLVIQHGNEIEILAENPEFIFRSIQKNSIQFSDKNLQKKYTIRHRMSEKYYLDSIQIIREHIRNGDIYEMNFCQEFFVEECLIDPLEKFFRLNELAKAPFSAFYRCRNNYLLCASPERFVMKQQQKLISQPMKGTRKRGNSIAEDEFLKKDLSQSIKDKAENIMIVDLVRNDLARSCKPGSVKVDELFGVYTFENVHQMISTVSGELKPEVSFFDALSKLFPMGSMTGAPKVKTMELIEQYELSRRGIFSGSVGYINPNGDGDFNVVIRSLMYNESNRYLSFQTGGAIVYDSVAEDEYGESLLKASLMKRVIEKSV